MAAARSRSPTRRGLRWTKRASERLSRGAESALTLVSAPAGSGKTTLLAEWLAAAPADRRSVAWLSLDQRDNDPALFWTYLVAALKTAAHGVGAGALWLLQSPRSPSEAGLVTLLNDLDVISVRGSRPTETAQTYMRVSGPRRVRVPVPRAPDRAVRCELPAPASARRTGARPWDRGWRIALYPRRRSANCAYSLAICSGVVRPSG